MYNIDRGEYVLRTQISLKKAPYSTGGDRIAHVAYAIFEGDVVFTACQPSYEGSSINYEEAIVTSICKLESIDHKHFDFFDLQTKKSYDAYTNRIVGNYRLPGSYQYEKVTFKEEQGRLCEACWSMTKCPRHVIDAFSDFLGSNPIQVDSTGDPIF